MRSKLARAILLLVLFASTQAASFCNTIEYFNTAALGEELDDIDPEDVVPQDPFLLAGLQRTHSNGNQSRNSSSAIGSALLSFVRQLLEAETVYSSAISVVYCDAELLALEKPIWLLTRKLLI